jgi:hypothetical protein
MTGDHSKGYSLRIRQGISSTRRTAVRGHGSCYSELVRMRAVNFGLQAYLDAALANEIAARLPTSIESDKQVPLLKSGLEVNPWYSPLANAVQAKLTSPARQVEFYHWLEDRLAQVSPPRDAKQGPFNPAVHAGLDGYLAKLPVPTDPADRQVVIDYLNDHSDAIWLKYQVVANGQPALQDRLAKELKASVDGERNPTDCALLAARIQFVGLAIKDAAAQQAWADELLPLLKDRAKYQFHAGKKTKTFTDPSAAAIQKVLESAQHRMARQAKRN